MQYLGRIAAATLLSALAAGPAVAQQLSPAETARGVTVLNRPRVDFDPLGIRLGGFRFDASADAGVGYDSNVFGRPRNTISDGFATEAARLQLLSDWTTHAVGVAATMEARQYFRRSELNWTDYNATAFGRYDFNQFDNIDLRYTHSRTHYDVFNFDVQAAGISRPVPYEYDEVMLNGTTRFNQFGIAGIGVFRSTRYNDVNVGGLQVRTSLNDHNIAIGGVTGSYELAPGRYINVIGRLTDITYSNTASRGRDSFTWEVLAGFTYDFDGVWSGRIAVGYRNREYRGANFRNLTGIAAEGEVTWAVTQLTTLRASARRSIEESIRGDSVSFTRTAVALNVDHELLRNVILAGEYAIDHRVYDRPSQTVMDGLMTIGARYLINRNVSVGLTYQWWHRLDRSAGIQEYDRSQVILRLRASL